jgi:uncharacterized protein
VIHPSTEVRFVSDKIGVGVFATERLPRGTITWARCELDQRFSPERVRGLGSAYAPLLDRYAYLDRDRNMVLCFDSGRLMNHSCTPAVLAPGFDIDLAIRDIEKGEELTCDYAALNITEDFPCECGKPECRKTIRVGDGMRNADAWDTLLSAAFPMIAELPQPLLVFSHERNAILEASRGGRAVPSCRRHFL